MYVVIDFRMTNSTRFDQVKHKERLVQNTVISLLEQDISESFFLDVVQHLHVDAYDDVEEERALAMLCGLPVCRNELEERNRNQQFSIRNNRVFDVFLRRRFCSDQCCGISQTVKQKLPTEPLWMFTGPRPQVDVQLLSRSDPSVKYQGALIDLMQRLELEEHEPAEYTVEEIVGFKYPMQDDDDDGSGGNEIEWKENPIGDVPPKEHVKGVHSPAGMIMSEEEKLAKIRSKYNTPPKKVPVIDLPDSSKGQGGHGASLVATASDPVYDSCVAIFNQWLTSTARKLMFGKKAAESSESESHQELSDGKLTDQQKKMIGYEEAMRAFYRPKTDNATPSDSRARPIVHSQHMEVSRQHVFMDRIKVPIAPMLSVISVSPTVFNEKMKVLVPLLGLSAENVSLNAKQWFICAAVFVVALVGDQDRYPKLDAYVKSRGFDFAGITKVYRAVQ